VRLNKQVDFALIDAISIFVLRIILPRLTCFLTLVTLLMLLLQVGEAGL
jgi:hypothetical protein